MIKNRWINSEVWGRYIIFSSIKSIKVLIKKKFFKKFLLTYTGRIYKIFLKKKFIKMNFNRSHKLIFKYNLKKIFFKIIPFDKKLFCWLQIDNIVFFRVIKKILKIRPLNKYT